MAYELNKKLSGIDPYSPVTENYPIRLDANESFINSGDRLSETLGETLKKIEFNRYPDPSAELAVKGFAEYYGLDPEMCTAGNGSDELISVIVGAFLEKGDTLLTLSPDFSMYAFYGYVDELKLQSLPKEENLTIDIRKVIEYCNNNNVKAVIFSNPCNPTSLGISRSDILKLIKNVFCLVIIDEAYMDFWGESILDEVQNYDNLIVLKTCSKNMGMAALRLGFAVAGRTITSALKAVKSPYNVNALTQAIACDIFRNKAVLKEYTAEIVHSRKQLQMSLSELAERFFVLERVYDSVTNFVFVKTPKAKEICEQLLQKGIAVRYMGGYLRITAGTENENQILTGALREILPCFELKGN